jgi:hypothetical protein
MESLRRFQALLLADLRERMRSSRFWTVMGLTAGLTWLCFPPADAHYIVLGVNNNHRGAYSSAWVGMVLAMLSVWTSLVGFYLVRGNLRRDFESGVWELLETTPMSRTAYLLAKWCSHMLVLTLVLLSQVLVGILAQWLRAEDGALDLAQLALPALTFGLPSLALTAMFAIWFDLVPALRRGPGNYVYFAVWLAILLAAVRPGAAQQLPAAAGWFSDPRGVTLFHALAQARLQELAQPLSFCVGCGFPTKQAVLFDWAPWQLSAGQLAGRAFWLLAALGGVLACGPLLDRIALAARRLQQQERGQAVRSARWLAALLRPLQRSGFGALLAAELQLALGPRSPWWWCGLAAAAAAQLAAPGDWAAFGVLAAWALLIGIYAGAPLRELEHRAGALIFSAAHAGRRILLARTVMLTGLGWLATLPAVLRWAGSAPLQAAAVLAVGLSLAAWSLALGAATRSARVAEALLCVLAYLGLQEVAVLNVASDPAWTLALHGVLLAPAALLLRLSWPRLQRAA